MSFPTELLTFVLLVHAAGIYSVTQQDAQLSNKRTEQLLFLSSWKFSQIGWDDENMMHLLPIFPGGEFKGVFPGPYQQMHAV